jgi:hypothetical protein
MLLQQLRHAKKAGVTVDKYRRIEFEIDLFPIVRRRLSVQTLRTDSDGNQRKNR